MSPTPATPAGLAGVVAGASAISHQDPAAERLTYRGYSVVELVERCDFEQVVHLLLYGELADRSGLERLCARERELRSLDIRERAVLDVCPLDMPPLRVMSAVLSVGEEAPSDDPRAGALALVAKLPVVFAHLVRRRRGERAAHVIPDRGRGLAANLLAMSFDRAPDPAAVRALEASLILHAEQGFNASTFAARTVASTGASLPGALTGGLAALAGARHGGAEEDVWRMLVDIDDPAAAEGWVAAQLDAGRRIPGFGHRVFRRRDPRHAPMRAALDRLASARGDRRLVALHDAVVDAVGSRRPLAPNIDLPAAATHHLLGFPPELFTPLFAVGRTVGWCAHALEQRAERAIIHPLAHYTGPADRDVPTRGAGAGY